MLLFRLTVRDSSGLSTIGATNFTVVEEMDYPPVANAGSSVLLHLPNNEVVLSGENSRDDKGIKKYEWSELEGKPVDIVVSDMSGWGRYTCRCGYIMWLIWEWVCDCGKARV